MRTVPRWSCAETRRAAEVRRATREGIDRTEARGGEAREVVRVVVVVVISNWP